MASSYPSGLDAFATTRADTTAMATTHATDHNNLADAVNKIEAELGTLPKGTYSTVRARIDSIETLSFNTQTGTAYTLVLTDSGKIVNMQNASVNTLTIPTNASVGFVIGTQILIKQGGTGQTSVAGATGVTLNARGGALKIAGQYGYGTLIKTGTDTWDLTGDTST